jgi:hypothetical protein
MVIAACLVSPPYCGLSELLHSGQGLVPGLRNGLRKEGRSLGGRERGLLTVVNSLPVTSKNLVPI